MRATKATLRRERRILHHSIYSHHRDTRATKATLHRERRGLRSSIFSYHRERRATKATLHRERIILHHSIYSQRRERRATKATLHRKRRDTPALNPLSSPREESHQGSSLSGEERASELNFLSSPREESHQGNSPSGEEQIQDSNRSRHRDVGPCKRLHRDSNSKPESAIGIVNSDTPRHVLLMMPV